MKINEFKWSDKGLICAVTQDYFTGEVLMQAYMNKEALTKTLDSGYATYFSRSRNCLWVKGETSGNKQRVIEIVGDCDNDCVLIKVEQIGGAACHTGNRSCFFNIIKQFEVAPDYNIIFDVANTIADRAKNKVEGSYTNYLLDKGAEKICKKIGEEATETVIAAIAGKREELVGELCDLVYHSLVLMQSEGVSLAEIFAELMKREGRPPHPKYAKLK